MIYIFEEIYTFIYIYLLTFVKLISIELTSLNYLGTGGFMSLVAERVQIHKATVCEVLWAFCSVMHLHIRKLVHFPRGQTAEDFKVAFATNVVSMNLEE